MRYALINPNWEFQGSIYFGCREPHLPVEFGYAKAILEREGNDVLLLDAHISGLSLQKIRERIGDFSPDITVVTTAPSYLFWRCPPPELRLPREIVEKLAGAGGTLVAVGPHGSATPAAALKKTGVDIVVTGEFEDLLPEIGRTDNRSIPSICYIEGGQVRIQGGPHEAEVKGLPALHWPAESIQKHHHQHHRFDSSALGPGAEMETSRGCPFRCEFCAKETFRNSYRKRPLPIIAEELDGLLAAGVEYVYFIDEIFMPDKELLEIFRQRQFKFGIQMRMDLWNEEMLQLLGEAGCVSIETGVESITEQGRKLLNKKSRISFDELTDRLIFAKKHVPFVQANLIATDCDNAEEIERWRNTLRQHGVWGNKPVPMFPYPGSPLYSRLWGPPDEFAWERAHEHYLKIFTDFSDIQEQHPLSLRELERGCAC